MYIHILTTDRDTSVGIATRYGLDAPRIESRWRQDFSHPSRPTLCWHSLPYNGYRVFPGVRRPGRGVDYPPPSSAEVKKRVELYLFFPSGTSWPVLRWTVPSPYIYAHTYVHKRMCTYALIYIYIYIVAEHFWLYCLLASLTSVTGGS
jgi:hypothetical protein